MKETKQTMETRQDPIIEREGFGCRSGTKEMMCQHVLADMIQAAHTQVTVKYQGLWRHHEQNILRFLSLLLSILILVLQEQGPTFQSYLLLTPVK